MAKRKETRHVKTYKRGGKTVKGYDRSQLINEDEAPPGDPVPKATDEELKGVEDISKPQKEEELNVVADIRTPKEKRLTRKQRLRAGAIAADKELKEGKRRTAPKAIKSKSESPRPLVVKKTTVHIDEETGRIEPDTLQTAKEKHARIQGQIEDTLDQLKARQDRATEITDPELKRGALVGVQEHKKQLAQLNLRLRSVENKMGELRRMPEREAVVHYITKSEEPVSSSLEEAKRKPTLPKIFSHKEIYQEDKNPEKRKEKGLGPIKQIKAEAEGWKNTIGFTNKQRRRKYNSIKEGTYYRGYKLFDRQGISPSQAAREKANVGISSNLEYVIPTTNFELIGNKDALESGQDRAAFTLEKPITDQLLVEELGDNKVRTINTVGEGETKLSDGTVVDSPTVPYNDLQSSLSEAGISATVRKIPGENKYKLHTDQGVHLNPHQQALLKEILQERYGLKHFFYNQDLKGAVWEQKVGRVPIEVSKIKGINEEDLAKDPELTKTTEKGATTRFGKRDEKNNLLEGEVDTLNVRVPSFKVRKTQLGDRAIFAKFGESTDAIGWGKSWRPGEQEINKAVFAIPRLHKERDLQEASEAYNKGNSAKLDVYLKKQYPDVNLEDENQRNSLRKHVLEFSAATGAAGYYTTKKRTGKRTINKGYKWSKEHIPGVSKLEEKVGIEDKFHNIIQDVNQAYYRPLVTKYHRALWRTAHPTLDPDNPVTVGFHPGPSPKVIYMQHIRYRNRFYPRALYGEAPSDVRFSRQNIERPTLDVLESSASREKIKSALENPGGNILDRLNKKITITGGRLAYHDTESKLTTRFEQNLDLQMEKLADMIHSHKVKVPYMFQEGAPAQVITDKQKQAAFEALQSLRKIKAKISQPTLIRNLEGDLTNEQFDKLLEEYSQAKRAAFKVNMESVAGKTTKVAKVGGVGLVAAGAGLTAYDIYRQKHQPSSDPFWRRVTPEHISIPHIKIRPTYIKVKENTVTRALDLENKSLLTGAKVRYAPRNIQIQNHKDVSNEPYKRGAPILGGFRPGVIGAPAPNSGSWLKSMFYERPLPDRGAQNRWMPEKKNLVVGGKKTPITFEHGNKERWGQPGRKLRTKSAMKMSAADRENLARFYVRTTDPNERSAVDHLMEGDERWEEMREEGFKFKNMYATDKNRASAIMRPEAPDQSYDKSDLRVGHTREEERDLRRQKKQQKEDYDQFLLHEEDEDDEE